MIRTSRVLRRTADAAGTPCRLLVVDDIADARDSLRLALEAEGYSVSVSADGAQALETLGRQNCDAVLTDLRMPQMDGAEFVRRVRQNPATAALPIIMMTASYTPPLREDVEADAFICKPFDFSALMELLTQMHCTP